MKSYVIIFLLAMFLLSSCGGCSESDWVKVTIPSEEALVFIQSPEPTLHYFGNIIAIPLNSNFSDTLFVSNPMLMQKMCYFKLAHPDKDISLEYLIHLDKNKRKTDARFINLVE